MGKDEDNLNASIAHIVLCCVAGRGISRMHGKSFTHPGMHANFFIHGILGILHYQSGRLSNDFGPAYAISLKASRYLALPCLMADLYRSDNTLSVIHLMSGLVPFTLALAGQDNIQLGNLIIAANIVSLAHYSMQNNREWGWYTAGAAVFAYFASPQMGKGGRFSTDFGPAYTISLKVSRCLALPCLMADLCSSSDHPLSIIHLMSGLMPFTLALTGKDNVQLGNLIIAANIVSLAHYSMQNNREWGWFTAGAAVFAYLASPKMGKGIMYPLGLALMEYCAHRLFHIHFEPPSTR